jgi:Phytanoyl-CoA dioxygenase (PhyH)
MLSAEQKQQFRQQGYLVVPNVLNADRVKWLRGFFRPKFDLPADSRLPGDSSGYLFLPFSRYPEVRWLFFHEPTMAVLKSLLGEQFAATPDDAVHLNGFGRWHRDTTSPELDGHRFHYEDDYLVVTVAYYLQDNTAEYGGGLDIQPGTHLARTDCFVAQRRERMNKKQPGVLRKAWQKVSGSTDTPGEFELPDPQNVLSIPSKAGDLVIFDCRIHHRATPGQQKNPPPDKEKIAIFETYSRNNAHASASSNYSRSRRDYVHLKDFSWPAELREQAGALGINLV